MPIPLLNESGLLPPGIHVCTLEEFRQSFGCFQQSDRWPQLFQKLQQFVSEVRKAEIIRALIINGSFVTGNPLPNDIDLLLVLPAGHDFGAEVAPAQYRVFDRHRVRRVYELDVFVVEEDSLESEALIRFFQRVRLKPGLTKGILRIDL